MTTKVNYQHFIRHDLGAGTKLAAGSAAMYLDSDGSFVKVKRLAKKTNKDQPIPRAKGYGKADKLKIKCKIMAWADLLNSRQSFKFITITFPQNTPDKLARTALNTWLTRIRKVFELQNYIWVAERQLNGTIHYHLLVDIYLPIRVINRYMSVTLANLLDKTQGHQIKFDAAKYNGVDISQVMSVSSTIRYVSKYLTKSSDVSDGAIWHCSRSISALVTSASFNEDNLPDRAIEGTLVKLHEIEWMQVVLGTVEVYRYNSGKIPKHLSQFLKTVNVEIWRQLEYSVANRRF